MSAGQGAGEPHVARTYAQAARGTTSGRDTKARTTPAPGTSGSSHAPTGSATASGKRPAVRVGKPPRRARLVVRYFDPWSVLKVTFVVSIVVLIVAVVAVTIIYYVLAQLGVWDSLNELVQDAADQSSGILHEPFTAPNIIGITAIVGGINVVLFTALGTLASFVYNLVADTVGGVEVTLSEGE